MSTTTYTFPAQRIEFVDATDELLSVRPATFAFGFDDDVSTITYQIIDRIELLPQVDFTRFPSELVINGQDRFTPQERAFDFFFSVGQVNWANGVTYLLNIRQQELDRNVNSIGYDNTIELGGAPLPLFSSVLELESFLLENEDNFSEISATNTFGPGRAISLADVPGVQIERPVEPEPEPEGPTEGPDVLDGTDDPDEIDGLGGNDTIRGGPGNDTLLGSAGADRLEGQDGNDVLNGGEGDDLVFGGTGDDRLTDGPGNDIVRGGAGNDTLVNEGGTDTFLGDAGRDLLVTDVTGLDPQGAFLRVNLQAGTHGRSDGSPQDRLGGIEDFSGVGSWDMEVTGDGGNNFLRTGSGNDTLVGNGGDDTLAGGDGGDVYFADAGDTIIELANDTGIDELRVSVSSSLDVAEIEQLTAIGSGNIRLDGTAGDEILVGNRGANILVGFGGEDTMTGGAGADTFVLTALRGTDPNVSITDWNDGDRLAIDDQLLGIGARSIAIRDLTPDVFRDLRDSGAVGYNSRTGEVRLDIDGDGDRELVATLEGGARLALDDVLLF